MVFAKLASICQFSIDCNGELKCGNRLIEDVINGLKKIIKVENQ